jgi:hypothetical protein
MEGFGFLSAFVRQHINALVCDEFRLSRVSAFDPSNLFRLDQNILPFPTTHRSDLVLLQAQACHEPQR